jgi:hypothetical protein
MGLDLEFYDPSGNHVYGIRVSRFRDEHFNAEFLYPFFNLDAAGLQAYAARLQLFLASATQKSVEQDTVWTWSTDIGIVYDDDMSYIRSKAEVIIDAAAHGYSGRWSY